MCLAINSVFWLQLLAFSYWKKNSNTSVIIYITPQMLSIELNLYWTRNTNLNDYQQMGALHDYVS